MTVLSRSIFIGALLLFLSTGTSAQEKPRLSVNADLLFPMSEFKKSALNGFGATLQLQVPLVPAFAFAVSAGYATWAGKNGSGTILKGIPLRAGLKFALTAPGGNKLYVGGEGGTFIDVSTEVSRYYLSYGPFVGIEFPMGTRTSVEISGRYDFFSRSGDKIENLGARVGVCFGI